MAPLQRHRLRLSFSLKLPSHTNPQHYVGKQPHFHLLHYHLTVITFHASSVSLLHGPLPRTTPRSPPNRPLFPSSGSTQLAYTLDAPLSLRVAQHHHTQICICCRPSSTKSSIRSCPRSGYLSIVTHRRRRSTHCFRFFQSSMVFTGFLRYFCRIISPNLLASLPAIRCPHQTKCCSMSRLVKDLKRVMNRRSFTSASCSCSLFVPVKNARTKVAQIPHSLRDISFHLPLESRTHTAVGFAKLIPSFDCQGA